MTRLLAALACTLVLAAHVTATPTLQLVPSETASAFVLASKTDVAAICVDPEDYLVVSIAARLFATDVHRVTGREPRLIAAPAGRSVVIAGTLGHSAVIDGLVSSGKLPAAARLAHGWETTLWQIVDRPAPGVDRALVIVGSDRRGTAYGLMQLSERIGVSPWCWWADVPVRHADTLALSVTDAQVDSPAVKYRGIFINDEDWGLNPWASHTFDPAFGNIGPKTYERVFELMLRLRLNYLWPAMHECSAEFASQPENIRLADRYGIVAGASHCEPMLCNNVHWDEKKQGKWDYTLNRDAIHAYWEDSARTRGADEAVWTLGIRGIHDRAMEGPPAIPTRIKIVSDVIADQRALLAHYVTNQWGPVAQCFVPYKEVLPIYDAGLKVPDDVTLVWVDDNFGYIRRLSAPAERTRSGGAGVYWHLSYYGGPHSYTWINTTAPALMWEELQKAWDNDARRLWVINVGDIKPMEIGIDAFAHLAWNPTALGSDAQPVLLHGFAERTFGANRAKPIADLLADFYRLGTIRKPELMTRAWAASLRADEAAQLEREYRELLERNEAIAHTLEAEAQDAYFETVGFPALVLAKSGLIFLADRKAQLGSYPAENERLIAQLRGELEAHVAHFNDDVAHGKWKRMMPGLVTAPNLMAWNSQVRWPWGDQPLTADAIKALQQNQPPADQAWRDAATADRQSGAARARWTPVPGLGASGHAMTVQPAGIASSWSPEDATAPTLEYDFTAPESSELAAYLDFVPTFRLYPGQKLRIALRVDNGPAELIEVPGSSGREDEVGTVRSTAVQTNFVRSRVPLPGLSAGRHTLKFSAVDPGAVVDRLALPTSPAAQK